MSRDRTNWNNDTSPFIDAANLNKIENALDGIYNENVTNVDTTGASGTGVIARFGPVCMMALTFVNPVAVGGSTDILQFPVGYIPYLDFNKIVISDATGENVGIARYNAATNRLTFTTNNQDGIFCKLSVTYITDVTPDGEVGA